MTIPKAIKILSEEAHGHSHTNNQDWYDAVKLLIEAGKAVRSARANNYWTPIPPLPGETKED